ncbi:XdhC family protein [Larkinella ripae]
MKEINRILAIYDQLDYAQRKVALATVVYVEGSAYRRPGARMLVSDDGRWEGAISGGCLEGDALRKARQIMLDGKPMVVRYDTMDDDVNSLGVGLGCNGIIDVFIEPIDPADPINPIALLREFSLVRDRRVIATVCRKTPDIDFREGSRFVLTGLQTDQIPTWLRVDMELVMAAGKSTTMMIPLPGGAVDVFIERMNPGIELVIFGAGYDTIPLTRLATEIGWRVTVTEDCIAHLAPKRFPEATCLLHANADAVTDKLSFTDQTAAVLMSHNYHYDLAVLTRLLETNVPYIGMLGPRKRYEKIKTQWNRMGRSFDSVTLKRVHSPIGLDLGAETPDEIALSILSEIKAFFSGRSGGFLAERSGPIHERAASGQEIVFH